MLQNVVTKAQISQDSAGRTMARGLSTKAKIISSGAALGWSVAVDPGCFSTIPVVVLFVHRVAK